MSRFQKRPPIQIELEKERGGGEKGRKIRSREGRVYG